MVWAWSLCGVVVPAVVRLAARVGLVAEVLAGAGLVAGTGLVAGALAGAGSVAEAGLVAGVLAGAELPVVAAWYWAIHWWRAG